MGHQGQRVITVTTAAGVGATYIPISRSYEQLNISTTVSGTATYTVDRTLDNIVRSQANSYDVHGETLTAPASAEWLNVIASQVNVAANFSGEVGGYALRVDITAGTGTVTIRILQHG